MDKTIDYFAMGRRIRLRRMDRRLTQGELAKAIGVSASFIGHLERGEKVASLETVVRLASALGCTLDALVLARVVRCDGECPLYEELKHLLDVHA